jgi:hypothetical protein
MLNSRPGISAIPSNAFKLCDIPSIVAFIRRRRASWGLDGGDGPSTPSMASLDTLHAQEPPDPISPPSMSPCSPSTEVLLSRFISIEALAKMAKQVAKYAMDKRILSIFETTIRGITF